MARKADRHGGESQSAQRIPTNKWTTEELANLYLPEPPWEIPAKNSPTGLNWLSQLRMERIKIAEELELEEAKERHSQFVTRYYEATAYHIWEIMPLDFALILITNTRWPAEARKAVRKYLKAGIFGIKSHEQAALAFLQDLNVPLVLLRFTPDEIEEFFRRFSDGFDCGQFVSWARRLAQTKLRLRSEIRSRNLRAKK